MACLQFDWTLPNKKVCCYLYVCSIVTESLPGQTCDQPYSDTSPKEVSECFSRVAITCYTLMTGPMHSRS